MTEDALTISPFDTSFFSGKKIFITGHTGFKGAWLCLWLHRLGAKVNGYALDPPTNPSLFELCNIDGIVHSTIADIRDRKTLQHSMSEVSPEIVIHMAAQPIVRSSYLSPAETYETNVMGTVNLFEAVRNCGTVKAVINVTTDKCYENKGWVWGYRENEPLGGYDPYSSSKACSELVTSAYRDSYFCPKEYSRHGTGIASARAGNVIGGGDWAADRLVPDCMRAFLKGDQVVLRNPDAVRPWQHVIEPLSGYLLLAKRLCESGTEFSGPWNFGPDDADAKTVQWIVEKLCHRWSENVSCIIDAAKQPHEAHYLKLDCSKAKSELGWHPRWNLDKALDSVIEWTRAFQQGKDMRAVCLKQIEEYCSKPAGSQQYAL